MAEHPIPERLLNVIFADIRSRVADSGAERPGGADAALSILTALPEINESTELEINWYSEIGPAAGATVNISANNLTLTIQDEDGTQEIYCCDAGCYPRVDRDDYQTWIGYFRSLAAPEIAISTWV